MFAEFEQQVTISKLATKDILKLAQSCEFKPLTFFSEQCVVEMIECIEHHLSGSDSI